MIANTVKRGRSVRRASRCSRALYLAVVIFLLGSLAPSACEGSGEIFPSFNTSAGPSSGAPISMNHCALPDRI